MKAIMKLACAVLWLGAYAVAQTPQTQTPSSSSVPTFKAGGEEVEMDVVVRDKKGRLVKDLKPEDFQIFDNGTNRPIKSFRLVDGSEAVSSTGVRTQLDPLRQIRLVTLIFHGLDLNGQQLSRSAALDMIKSELGQNVFVAVMSIDHNLQAIQSFTNNRDLLRKAIDRATSGAHDFSHDTSQMVTQLQNMAGPVQGGDGSLGDQTANLSANVNSGSGAGGKPDAGSAANAAMAQMMLQMIQASQDDVTSDTGRNAIYALLDCVKEQYRLPGRKTILLFSTGFSVPQGMDQAFKNVISIANRSDVSFYSIDARGLTTVSMNKSALDSLGSATAAARKNATPGQTVTTDMARSEDRSMDSGKKNTQDTLGVLAQETGGELIANTNDFRGPLRKLNEDIQTHYELSYDPNITNYDGSFRKVAVKTDVADLRVQSRAGYFALPPSLTAGGQVVLPYELPLLKALDTKPLPKEFAFQATGMHFRNEAGASSCEVVLDVPLGNLTLQQEKGAAESHGKLAYVAIVKDMQGQILKKFRNEVALNIPAEKLAAFKAGRFVYSEPFNLSPGRYTLEVAVLDGQGEKISARKSSFMIPVEGSALSISSISVVRSVKPADASANANDPLRMENNLITPSLNAVVKKSAASGLPFYVVIYPDKTNTDKTALQMEFSRDGQVLGRVAAPIGSVDAQGRIQYVATAPVDRLEAGNYQVRFIARQGSEAAVESVTFTIEP